MLGDEKDPGSVTSQGTSEDALLRRTGMFGSGRAERQREGRGKHSGGREEEAGMQPINTQQAELDSDEEKGQK